MEINIKEKSKINNIQVGDIFYSSFTNSYSYLTPTHENDNGDAMYSLVTISNPGTFYSVEVANIPLNDIIHLIERDDDLVHYSQHKYKFKLDIIQKDLI